MNYLKIALLIVSLSWVGYGCSKHVTPEKEHHEEGLVHLKVESQKLIDFEIVPAKKQLLVSAIDVSGEIAQETENVMHVSAPNVGILKSIQVGLGQVVEKDTPLCLIQTREGQEIEIKSPHRGIVLAQYLKEGDAVDTVSSILTIADPDILRASFNVYEKDLSKVQMNQKVIVKTAAYPEKKFEGKVVFISPQVDSSSRTIKIRVNISNKDYLLKFGMFVTGQIISSLPGEALVIPEEAIQEIEGQTVVFMPKSDDKEDFVKKTVKIGRKSEG